MDIFASVCSSRTHVFIFPLSCFSEKQILPSSSKSATIWGSLKLVTRRLGGWVLLDTGRGRQTSTPGAWPAKPSSTLHRTTPIQPDLCARETFRWGATKPMMKFQHHQHHKSNTNPSRRRKLETTNLLSISARPVSLYHQLSSKWSQYFPPLTQWKTTKGKQTNRFRGVIKHNPGIVCQNPITRWHSLLTCWSESN